MKAILYKSPRITEENLAYLKSIVEFTQNNSEADFVLSIGGDNTMLRAIHGHYDKNLPFFGMNFGKVGFLLNNVRPKSPEDFFNIINSAKEIELWTLECRIEYDRFTHTRKAFNDIWLSPSGGQTIRMKMTINGRTMKGTIVGDGIIVSTPQGSTGYNRSAGGKIIKPSIPVLQVTPKSCTIGDRRAVMSSFIEKDDSIISIEFEDYEYRSAEVWADGIRLNKTNDPIKRIIFKKSPDTVRLLFDNEYGFYDKIYNLQYDSGACQIG